ncbi:head-tail connector protein [Mycoplana sp. BE70]|uniref:head-tail connector protein n=1 Tax=Mycoplana sp. BE70 TaxID=2817775 RepID=UPI00286B4DB9|nr:head-tail connector protein [Mycoplana sp. BE70]
MLAPVRTSAPASTPVSLVEAKASLRVDFSDDDDLITSLIAAAVNHFDGWSGTLGRALVTQSWRQDFGRLGVMRLPVGPVASIAKIEYFDGDNVVQTVADTVYTLRTDAVGSYVDLAPDQAWPTTHTRPDAVSVTYVAGTAAADVPAAIKTALLLMVGHFYANREAVGEARSELPFGVHALVAPYRRVGV